MSSNAPELAKRYYQHHGRDFSKDWDSLGRNPRAVLVWLPDLVVLMKPVHRHDVAPWFHLSSSPLDADAWYVHLLVGKLSLACQLGMGLEPLPYLCFQRGMRDERVHVCRWQVFLSRGCSLSSPSLSNTNIERISTMGFIMPDTSTAPATVTPPTVTITEADASNTISQQKALADRRRGLVSTLNSSRQASAASPSTVGSSSTLGS